MLKINPKSKISELTVEEFFALQQARKTYAYGIKGIAKIFGVSRNTAGLIKSSGVIDKAIYQRGNIIVIDVERALELFNESK